MMNAKTVELTKFIKGHIKRHRFLILALCLMVASYTLLHVPYKTTFTSLDDMPKAQPAVSNKWDFKEKLKEAQGVAADFKPIEGEDPIEQEKRFMKHVEERTKR